MSPLRDSKTFPVCGPALPCRAFACRRFAAGFCRGPRRRAGTTTAGARAQTRQVALRGPEGPLFHGSANDICWVIKKQFSRTL